MCYCLFFSFSSAVSFLLSCISCGCFFRLLRLGTSVPLEGSKEGSVVSSSSFGLGFPKSGALGVFCGIIGSSPVLFFFPKKIFV